MVILHSTCSQRRRCKKKICKISCSTFRFSNSRCIYFSRNYEERKFTSEDEDLALSRSTASTHFSCLFTVRIYDRVPKRPKEKSTGDVFLSLMKSACRKRDEACTERRYFESDELFISNRWYRSPWQDVFLKTLRSQKKKGRNLEIIKRSSTLKVILSRVSRIVPIKSFAEPIRSLKINQRNENVLFIKVEVKKKKRLKKIPSENSENSFDVLQKLKWVFWARKACL